MKPRVSENAFNCTTPELESPSAGVIVQLQLSSLGVARLIVPVALSFTTPELNCSVFQASFYQLHSIPAHQNTSLEAILSRARGWAPSLKVLLGVIPRSSMNFEGSRRHAYWSELDDSGVRRKPWIHWVCRVLSFQNRGHSGSWGALGSWSSMWRVSSIRASDRLHL